MYEIQSIPGETKNDFAVFALPTAVISLAIAAILLGWPEWCMRMVASQSVQGNLFWIVGVTAIVLDTATQCISLGRKAGSPDNIVKILLLAVFALCAVWIFEILANQDSPFVSSMFWQRMTPTQFRSSSAELLAWSYFALVTAMFIPPMVTSVLAEIAENLFAEGPVVPRPAG